MCVWEREREKSHVIFINGYFKLKHFHIHINACIHFFRVTYFVIKPTWITFKNWSRCGSPLCVHTFYQSTVTPRFTNVSDDVLCLELRTLLGFGNEYSAVNDDIVSLGKNMGMEVNNEVGLKQSWMVTRDRKKKKDPLPNNNISLPHHLPLTPSTLLHTGMGKLN